MADEQDPDARKKGDKTSQISIEVPTVAFFCATGLAGASGGFLQFLWTRDDLFPQDGALVMALLFGVAAGLIGVYVVAGTNVLQWARTLSLAIAFGFSGPLVLETEQKLLVGEPKESAEAIATSQDFHDEVLKLMKTMELTPSDTNDSPGSSDPTPAFFTIRAKAMESLAMVPLLPDKASKRTLFLYVLQDVSFLTQTEPHHPLEVKYVIDGIRPVSRRIKGGQALDVMLDSLEQTADIDLAKLPPPAPNVSAPVLALKDGQAVQQKGDTASASPEKTAGLTGYIRVVNVMNGVFEDSLFHGVSTRDAITGKLTTNTDVYLRAGLPTPSSQGLIFPPEITIIRQGTPVEVLGVYGPFQTSIANLTQYWALVRVPPPSP